MLIIPGSLKAAGRQRNGKWLDRSTLVKLQEFLSETLTLAFSVCIFEVSAFLASVGLA